MLEGFGVANAYCWGLLELVEHPFDSLYVGGIVGTFELSVILLGLVGE